MWFLNKCQAQPDLLKSPAEGGYILAQILNEDFKHEGHEKEEEFLDRINEIKQDE